MPEQHSRMPAAHGALFTILLGHGPYLRPAACRPTHLRNPMSAIALLSMPMPQAAETNPLAMFIPLVLIFVVFYFFIIRPQKKKEDARKKMVEAVRKGDKVVTIGGIHGMVTQVDENTVLIQADTNTKLRVEKSALSNVSGKD